MNAVTRALAIEYAPQNIRVNAVAAGIIDTPMHKAETHDFLKTLHPIQRIGKVSEIIDAVTYLTEATFVTGEVLHVDGGAHAGKWQGDSARKVGGTLAGLGLELPEPPAPLAYTDYRAMGRSVVPKTTCSHWLTGSSRLTNDPQLFWNSWRLFVSFSRRQDLTIRTRKAS